MATDSDSAAVASLTGIAVLVWHLGRVSDSQSLSESQTLYVHVRWKPNDHLSH